MLSKLERKSQTLFSSFEDIFLLRSFESLLVSIRPITTIRIAPISLMPVVVAKETIVDISPVKKMLISDILSTSVIIIS